MATPPISALLSLLAKPSERVLRVFVIPFILLTSSVQADIPQAIGTSDKLDQTLFSSVTIGPSSTPFQQKIIPLTATETIGREMRWGETHSYSISVVGRQCLYITLAQNGIDVSLVLYGPDQQPLLNVDTAMSRGGTETLTAVVDLPGAYRLDVSSPKKQAPPWSYQLTLAELRSPTLADEKHGKAEQYLYEAVRLRVKPGEASKQQAIIKLKEALSIWRESNDLRKQSQAFYQIGKTYQSLQQNELALDSYNQALAIWRNAGDRAEQAYMLNEIAAFYRDTNERKKAETLYDEALKLRIELGDVLGQAQVLSNFGLVLAQQGSMYKAKEYYQKALDLAPVHGDRSLESLTRNNLAGALDSLGNSQLALETYEQLLRFCQNVGESSLEAATQNNIALIYDIRGELQLSLEHYNRALLLYEEIRGDPASPQDLVMSLDGRKATTLDNIALLYAGLGETDKALEYLSQSNELRLRSTDKRGKANTLNYLGYVNSLLGNASDALKFYEQSLKLRMEVNDKRGLGYTLTNLGSAHLAQGDTEKAIAEFTWALELRKESGDARGQAITLSRMGEGYAALKDFSRAQESFAKALSLSEAANDKQASASALYGLSRLERDKGNLSKALQTIERAINIAESLRTKVISERLRRNYFATKHDYYELAVDIAMRLHEVQPDKGYEVAAFQLSERARARSLLDLLEEAAALDKEVDPKLIQQRALLQAELNAKAERSLRVSAEYPPDAAQVQREFSQLVEKFDDVQTQIRLKRKSDFGLAPEKLPTLSETQQLLGDDTLLLEYALGERRSYLWLVSVSTVRSYTLPGRAEIENLALQLRHALSERPSSSDQRFKPNTKLNGKQPTDYLETATKLSRVLLGTAADQLGKKRLLIVAEGILQYIPYSVLLDPVAVGPGVVSVHRQQREPASFTTPLFVQHELTSLPSASSIVWLRRLSSQRKLPARSLAILADPVFERDDPRIRSQRLSNDTQGDDPKRAVLTREGINFSRLQFTGDEARSIISVLPARAGVMEALGFKATRAVVLSPQIRDYRFIHLATHAIMNDKHPELSGIVFSMFNEKGKPQEGFMGLADIYGLRLSSELVVLSACRTGLGKEVKGEGLVGLTRGFLQAGSSRVLASLWRVDDEATAELMRRFYTKVFKEGATPSAALRLAQLDLWNEGIWGEPYYWAPFVMHGEWR